jgi:hypothetical protein
MKLMNKSINNDPRVLEKLHYVGTHVVWVEEVIFTTHLVFDVGMR